MMTPILSSPSLPTVELEGMFILYVFVIETAVMLVCPDWRSWLVCRNVGQTVLEYGWLSLAMQILINIPSENDTPELNKAITVCFTGQLLIAILCHRSLQVYAAFYTGR